MKRKYLIWSAITLVCVFILAAAVSAQNDTGAIKISSAEDFLEISEDLGGKYVLTKDIDLTNEDFYAIGTSTTPFSGVLDGAGYTLTVDLSASKTTQVMAIFDTLSGTVKNLKIKGSANANVQGGNFALVASNAVDGAIIENCENYAELTVSYSTNKANVAPFVAHVDYGLVTIRGCINYGKISTKNTNGIDASVGGLVGYTEDDTEINIERCANRAEINVDGGRSNIGGIIGQTSVGSAGTVANITLCCNTGNINYYNEAGERAAGIIGYIKSGKINYCYNTGEIKAYKDSGKTPARSGYGSAFGIFGYANLTVDGALSVVGCYNATVDPLEAEICVIRNASYGYFENFVMQGRTEYELELLSANVSAGEAGTEFVDAEELLVLLEEKCAYFVKNENGGYPVFVWEQGGVLKAGEDGLGLSLSFRQNKKNKDAHDIRFCVVASKALFEQQAKTKFYINFYKDGKVLAEHTPILSVRGGEFTQFSSIYANRVEYKAEDTSNLYVCEVSAIPYEAWDKIEVYAEVDSESVCLGKLEYADVYKHSQIITFEDIPSYRSEKASVSERFNCGTMLGDDSKALVGDESYMYVISSTNVDEYEAYISRMVNAGFKVEQDRTIDSNRTCTLTKNGEKTYYVVHFVSARRQVQIIQENSSSVTPIQLSYDAPANSVTPVLYQYSLNYTGSTAKYQDNRAINCGMLYIIRLPDNTLFVVDGGHGKQISDYSLNGIYDFMKKITGTKDGEKVQIAGWFFTHAHGDHNGLAAAFLGQKYENTSTVSFQNKVDVKSVIYNYPSYVTMSSGYALTEVQVMKRAMRNNYPNAKTLKVHTGQRFTLAGVHFDVLYTFEDMVNSAGKTTISNFNDSSTVLKVTFPNGQTYMQLGDIDRSGMKVFNAMYSSETMKSDMVQISHHAFNNLSELYERINAPVALIPNSEKNAKNSQWGSFAPYTEDFYYADVYTYALEMKDKKYIDVTRYDHVG